MVDAVVQSAEILKQGDAVPRLDHAGAPRRSPPSARRSAISRKRADESFDAGLTRIARELGAGASPDRLPRPKELYELIERASTSATTWRTSSRPSPRSTLRH